MRFVQGNYLFLLWLIPVFILAYLYVQRHTEHLLSRAGDKHLIARMMAGRSRKRKLFRFCLLLLVFAFVVLAIARPQYGLRTIPVTRKGIDVVVAVDTSLSMLAEDIKPSRLLKARHEITALTGKLRGDRIGIVTFAGKAFIQCPLTIDYDAVSMFVDSIDAGSIPLPGTNIADAIDVALRVFNQNERKYKVLILITDGEDHDENAVNAAKKAAGQGVVICTIGIGSPQGEPIPVVDDNGVRVGYKKDGKGNVVVSRLNEKLLQDVALTTEGSYYHATPAEFELDRIYQEIRSMDQKDIRSTLAEQYEDRYQYPLFLALIMLIAAMIIPEMKGRKNQ